MVARGYVVDRVYGCLWLYYGSCLWLIVVILWIVFMVASGYVVDRVYGC